jgi:hypothetical protein
MYTNIPQKELINIIECILYHNNTQESKKTRDNNLNKHYTKS